MSVSQTPELLQSTQGAWEQLNSPCLFPVFASAELGGDIDSAVVRWRTPGSKTILFSGGEDLIASVILTAESKP